MNRLIILVSVTSYSLNAFSSSSDDYIIRHSQKNILSNPILENEESFHKKKMENYLTSAENAAREGNRSRYQNNIRWAQEQAQILNLDIADRISEISLSDEESFHKKKMENYLTSAENAAREGNRSRYQNNRELTAI